MKTSAANQLVDTATLLRFAICEWFGADAPERVILAPGMLIALRLLLASLNTRTLLLTTDEYYAPHHFTGIDVHVCSPNVVPQFVEREKPGAVLVSVVSWRGRALDVRGIFQQISATRSQPTPLLIADYAHAGAIGFPKVGGLGADLTIGDLNKWMLPPYVRESLAFLHVTNPRLQSVIEAVFRGFYLATTQSVENSARWLSPSALLSARNWIKGKNIRREDVLEQYQRNRKLADSIANLHRTVFPSCIGWISTTRNIKKMEAKGLVWKRNDGIRIMCRELTYKKASADSARKKLKKGSQISQSSA